ncbi:unnamed protein product [Arabis nemorensis]|uniref:Uncharacterized protein n=1 Tax=Arabis nemorensis TaxID=586526 RepID=A0A565CPR7_9BRAS|nr:unnamed protein product [Arabis nemorensis]
MAQTKRPSISAERTPINQRVPRIVDKTNSEEETEKSASKAGSEEEEETASEAGPEEAEETGSEAGSEEAEEEAEGTQIPAENTEV